MSRYKNPGNPAGVNSANYSLSGQRPGFPTAARLVNGSSRVALLNGGSGPEADVGQNHT